MSIITTTLLHSDDNLPHGISTSSAATILFVGANRGDFSCLQRFFEKRGCRCSFASSAREALALFGSGHFELILDRTPFQSDPSALIALGTHNCSTFRCCQVEIGALWLPVVVRGEKCFGRAALRPKEFVVLLEDAIAQPECKAKAACQ